MADLSVVIGGRRLRNPIIVSSSPLTSTVERMKKAERCGAGAVCVKHTMAHQPFRGAPRYWVDRELGMVICSDRRLDVEEGEKLIAEAKGRLDIPVIANMSGPAAVEGWGEVAQRLVAAGADMIEINFNCPNIGLADRTGAKVGADVPLGGMIGQYPELAKAVAQEIRRSVSVPVIAKLTAEGGKIVEVSRGCAEAGVDALNVRATYAVAPGIDIYHDGKPLATGLNGKVNFSALTGRYNRLISNRFVGLVSQSVPTTIIGGGGIFQWEHVVEKIMYGSSAVQICTAFILNGFEIMEKMLERMEAYMDRRGYANVEAFRGAALKHVVSAAQLQFEDVVSYVTEDKCNGCKRCLKIETCDAIEMRDGKAFVMAQECVGCSICTWICPTKAMAMVSPTSSPHPVI